MIKSLEQFCHSILSKEITLRKALVNLVLAVSASPNAESVTSVSQSKCYHYQYSSIGKSISSIGDDISGFDGELLGLLGEFFPAHSPSSFWLLNTDSSPLIRPYSDCLANRRYVYAASSKVGKNRPIAIGHEFSTVGLSMSTNAWLSASPPWNLPLSMELLPFDQNRNSFTAKQVNNLLDCINLPIGKSLTVNTLDSNYCSPLYIADTYHQANLVNIIRISSNRNVWTNLDTEQALAHRHSNQDNRGASKVYGDKYKLNQFADWALQADEQVEFGIRLKNGKVCKVKMQAWNSMMIRTKKGKSMKDKPFRLCSIQLMDAQTNQLLFKKPLLLGIWGKREKELSLEQIFWAYRARFDIEHFFRFSKQNLLLDSFQTPDEEHQKAWLKIVQLAYWMLWLARSEAEPKSKKWQQYAYKNTQACQSKVPTPSQVQQQMENIILAFEQEPLVPKLKLKGKGRLKGEIQPKRAKNPVRRKAKKAKAA